MFWLFLKPNPSSVSNTFFARTYRECRSAPAIKKGEDLPYRLKSCVVTILHFSFCGSHLTPVSAPCAMGGLSVKIRDMQTLEMIEHVLFVSAIY